MMPIRAVGSCETEAWKEEPYFVKEGDVKLTRASVTTIFRGDITGAGAAEYLMTYLDPAAGTFVGVERIVGSVGGRTGSFVVQSSGAFEKDALHADWSVVQDSGKDGLANLRGSGTYLWERKQERVTSFTFDYGFGE